MSPAVTVIAQVEGSDESLVKLTESIDAQTLPYSAFDVVFLVHEGQSETLDRLGQLAQRRPNVQVQSYAGEVGTAVLDRAREARGEWVLPIGASLQGASASLLPAALERVVAFGDEHRCDIVVGRVSASVASIPIAGTLREDGGQAEAERVPSLLESPVKAYRTEFVRTHGELADSGTANVAGQVGVLASYPLLRDATIGVGASGPLSAEVSVKSAAWHDGSLALVVGVTGPADGSLALSVRHLDEGSEYWLQPAQAREADVFAADLDVRTAAAGAPLAEGRWQIYANVYGADGSVLARSPLSAVELPGAAIDQLIVAPSNIGGILTLDVGGTKTSPLPPFTVEQVTISEDAAGALLVARLDDLHVAGSAEHPAALRLGAFRLPGRFVSDGGRARLECFVSGLASTNVLSHQLGFGPIKRTSLDLIIDEVGGITVVPTSEQKAAPAKPAAKGPKSKRRSAAKRRRAKAAADAQAERSVLTKLRRRVPSALEPAVQKIAGNPRARDLYRTLTGRNRTAASR